MTTFSNTTVIRFGLLTSDPQLDYNVNNNRNHKVTTSHWLDKLQQPTESENKLPILLQAVTYNCSLVAKEEANL